jgi:large subunit ribosomal protein L1
MAKQKMKTVDMSVSAEELDKIILPEEAGSSAEAIAVAEKQHLKDLKEQEKADKAAKKAAKEVKTAGIETKIEAKAEENKEKEKKPKKIHERSKTYIATRRLIDRTKTYDLKKAVELVKKTSYTKFPGTVVADLVTKDDKVSAEVKFPHSTGKSLRVAIATEELIKDIDAGKLDFDILVTAPAMMPKLAKYARTLGPKGLMPNPKNQTITPNPEKRKAELEGGKVTVKTEKKSPLMHVTLGKTDMDEKDLAENLETLINSLNPKKIVKLVLSATMSPGIKVDLSPYQTT